MQSCVLFIATLQLSQSLALTPTSQQFLSQFNSSDFVYDLRGAKNTGKGLSGTKRFVTRRDMPALTGEGLAMGLVTIEPCGINLPNHHPRGSELFYVVEGSFLRSGLLEENGGRSLVSDVSAGQVVFYPQGLVHYQQNLGCETAVLLTTFSSDDPGFVEESVRLGELPVEALASTFNRSESFIGLLVQDLPEGIASGRASCLDKCKTNSIVGTTTTTTTNDQPIYKREVRLVAP